MRFILSVLLIGIFSFIAGLFLPWWSIAIISFLVALLWPQSPWRSFLAGFLGIFILWSVLALIIDAKNEHILSQKIALLMKVGSTLVLVLVTSLIGALVGGFAAMSGSSLRLSRK